MSSVVRAWLDAAQSRGEETHDLVGARNGQEWRADQAAAVGDELHPGCEDLYQPVDVAARRRAQAAFGDGPPHGRIGLEPGQRVADVVAGASRELADSGLGLVECVGDLGVAEAEDLAQDEAGPLERRERFEHDEHPHRD